MAKPGRKDLPPGPGRPKGCPNKATLQARRAIGLFVDNNAHRLQGWLDSIADGTLDKKGDYVVKPDPVRAFELFQSVIEYHVPKLARTEVTGEGGGPVIIQSTPTDDAL
jgi:hypothetical protein